MEMTEKQIQALVLEIFESLIQKTKEETKQEVLLLLPDVVSRLFLERASMEKLKEVFFKDNPDFMKHKKITAAIIQKMEGDNPGKSYSEILEDATPLIKQRIKEVGGLDLTKVERPTNPTFHGGSHGEL